MRVPRVDRLGSMGIDNDYDGIIEGEVDTIEEAFVFSKVQAVVDQYFEMADAFIRSDNSPDDMDRRPGSFISVEEKRSIDGKENIDLCKILKFNPKTRRPLKLEMATSDGKFKSVVIWDENGGISSAKDIRMFEDRVEEVEIKRDANNIFYKEKIVKSKQ